MSRKKSILLVLFVIACISAIVGVKYDDRNVQFVRMSDGTLGISVREKLYEEVIKPYYNSINDTYYYFMPSSLCGKHQVFNDYCLSFSVNSEAIRKYGCYYWDDNVAYIVKYGDIESKIVFTESSKVASLFITTQSGSTESLDADKTNMEAGMITVFEADGTVTYSGGLTLKGRGNSTYRGFEKKPYNIKLDNEAGILGMELDKDYCLLANSWDYSYMNNILAFDMAKNVGFKYVPDAEYADVYFNGEYWGLYLVTEKVEIGNNRIDITDLSRENEVSNPGGIISDVEPFDYGYKRGVHLANLPNDISGGYLIERDYRLRPDYSSRVFTPSYFETDEYGTCFNIKSPEYADEAEVNYIGSLVSEMEQAIISADGFSETGKYYTDYIDIDSWVKCYMIAEIAYDLDKDVTNTYYYKDRDYVDSRFYAGLVWDYDCRFGGTYQYSNPNILTKLTEDVSFSGGYAQYLYDKNEFYDEICNLWNSFFEGYLREDAQENIDIWRELIRKSVENDNVRWDRNEGYKVTWPVADNSSNFTTTYVFGEQVDHLKQWIESRRICLDGYWGNK